jgi:NADPH-dependent curcumin reductase CurA
MIQQNILSHDVPDLEFLLPDREASSCNFSDDRQLPRYVHIASDNISANGKADIATQMLKILPLPNEVADGCVLGKSIDAFLEEAILLVRSDNYNTIKKKQPQWIVILDQNADISTQAFKILPMSIECAYDCVPTNNIDTCLEEATSIDIIFQNVLSKFNDFTLKYNESKARLEAFKTFQEAQYDIYKDKHRSRYIVIIF